jgi:hypothetical protein
MLSLIISHVRYSFRDQTGTAMTTIKSTKYFEKYMLLFSYRSGTEIVDLAREGDLAPFLYR